MIVSFGKGNPPRREFGVRGGWVLSEAMMDMAVLLFRSHLCLCHGLERASGRAWELKGTGF